MRIRSCKNRRVSEVIIGEDPDQGVYVKFEREIAGRTDTVIDVTAVAQNEGRDTNIEWTEVMLLGNGEEQDTAAKPLASHVSSEKAFVANSLYRRFYRLPAGVKIRLDPIYHRFADSPRMFSAYWGEVRQVRAHPKRANPRLRHYDTFPARSSHRGPLGIA